MSRFTPWWGMAKPATPLRLTIEQTHGFSSTELDNNRFFNNCRCHRLRVSYRLVSSGNKSTSPDFAGGC